MNSKLLKITKLIFLISTILLSMLFLVFSFLILRLSIGNFMELVFEYKHFEKIPALLFYCIIFLLCISYFSLVSALCGYLIFRTFVPYPKYTYQQYKEQKNQKKLEKLKQKLNELEKGE